ncbi:MAG: hypothetical protein R6V39_00895 [Desulfovibrionales bacterium]
MGNILVEAGTITDETLKQAKAYQQEKEGIRLDKAFLEIGALTGREIADALSTRLKIPFITMDNIFPPPEILDLVPARIALTYSLIPVLTIKQTLIIAVSNPLDEKMLDDLYSNVNMTLHLAVAPGDEITEAVNACYSSQENNYQADEKKVWVWPDKHQSLAGKQMETDRATEGRGKRPHAFEPDSESNHPKEPANFFAHARQQATYESNKFDIFGSATGKNLSKNAKKATGFEGILSVTAKPASPEEKQADITEKEADNPSAGSVNTESIKHLEKGLEALQKGSYKEALAKFEAALEHDPENRVCKANIQRIKKILAEKNR